MTPQTPSLFSEQKAQIDAALFKYLARFENGGLDRLVEKWWKTYFDRQDAETDESRFRDLLRTQIEEYVAYLSSRPEKIDYDLAYRMNWVEGAYRELLDDGLENPNSTKQEETIERVGAKARILSIL